MAEIHGDTAAGFEKVADEYRKAFDEGLEVGSSFAAYHRGEKVVDLWGGVADQSTGRAWDEDTIALTFSTTKGVTAICANKLAQEGRLDPEAPVVTYWPEFGKNGKEDVPVKYLLSHQAGLAWVDGPLTAEEALSWEPVIEALENQHPAWHPGERHGYHATTYGWLVGEVIKRITSTTVGTYFREQIAEPLGVDYWIGLPESEEPRVAPLISFLPEGVSVDSLADPGEDPVAQLMAQFLGPDTDLGRSLFAPGGAFTDMDIFNSRAMRAAEVPAANGVGNARSLAKLYGACVSEVDGTRVLDADQVERATTQLTEGPNTILFGMDIQFGLGFMLHSSLIALGGPRSFGHFGMGGSMGWADPDAELAVGYVMNRMDMGLTGDMRSFRCINACYEAID